MLTPYPANEPVLHLLLSSLANVYGLDFYCMTMQNIPFLKPHLLLTLLSYSVLMKELVQFLHNL